MPIAQQPARKFSAYQNNYYQNSKEDKDNNYRYRDVNKSYTRSFSIHESSMPLKYINKYITLTTESFICQSKDVINAVLKHKKVRQVSLVKSSYLFTGQLANIIF